MQNVALIDHGTLSASHAVLFAGRTPFYTDNSDISICCLSSLVESIVLFDKLLLPGVPHGFSDQLSKAFGDAIQFVPLDGRMWHAIERDALRWVCEKISVMDALDFSHLSLNGRHFIGSTDKGIAAALSVLDEDAFSLPLTLSFNFEPPAAGDEGDGGHPDAWKREWEIRSRLIRALHEARGIEYREVFQNADPTFRVESLDLENMYWGAFRSRCYDLLARSFEIPYLPHPLRARSALAVRCLDMQERAKRNPFLAVLDDAYDEARRYVNEKTGDWLEPFTMSPLLPYILKKCRAKDEVIPRAYEVRDSRGARALRQRLAAIGEANSLQNMSERAKELDSLKRMLDSDLGLGGSDYKLSFSIAGIVSTTVPMPEGIKNFIGKHVPQSVNSRLLFLRNIYKEMAQAASLGKYYEFLTRGKTAARGLELTEDDLKARAQYLHAILMNMGQTEHEAKTLTVRMLRGLTHLPANTVHSLVVEALAG